MRTILFTSPHGEEGLSPELCFFEAGENVYVIDDVSAGNFLTTIAEISDDEIDYLICFERVSSGDQRICTSSS